MGGPPSVTPVIAMSAKGFRSHIPAQGVVIVSKSVCPFCNKAAKLLSDLGVPFSKLEIDLWPASEMSAFQDQMRDEIGARTVPQVFANGAHIGDCEKIHTLH